MRGLSLVLLLALAGSCAGREPPPPPGPATPESLEARRAACERRGGSFAPSRPGSDLLLCFQIPRDANRACTSGADCEGVCLARSRTCAPVVPLMGCNDVLLEGGSVARECIN